MEIETTEIDKYIRTYVGIKSPREIADLSGASVQDVIRRAEGMKDEVDALSIEAQISFAMRSLNEIASDAKTAAASAPSAKDASGLYSAAVAAIAQSLKQLNALKKENDGAVVTLNNLRMQEILRLYDVVIEQGSRNLAKAHGLNEEEVKDYYLNSIVIAAKTLEMG